MREVGTHSRTSVTKEDADEVHGQRYLLGLIHAEEEVGIAHDHTWRLDAELPEQVHVLKRTHRLATNQTGDRAYFVDEEKLKALTHDAMERLERAHDHLAICELGVVRVLVKAYFHIFQLTLQLGCKIAAI
eukprot:3865776-Prymnesium_polylepis.1